MSEWFYAKGGQQGGPVSFEQLRDLARSGGLDPENDMAWSSGMKDWQPAGRIDGLFAATHESMPPADPANPYAAPQSSWNEPVAAGGALQEIMPGSEPIDIGACVKRGFEITKRNFGMILLVGLTYIAVSIGLSILLTLIDTALGLGTSQNEWQSDDGLKSLQFQQTGSALNMIVSQVFSIFLSLGLVRVGLNLVSGKEVSVGQLFGEGRKLLPAIGASILFAAMVFVGMLLLIIPGIYLMLRYGQFMNAMVDRNLGVLESLSYSSSITTNNRLNLFLLAIISIGIIIAGILALLVGLIFAYPVVWMSWMVAFRWMQYGNRAVGDHPGTQTPVLSGV
jgi:uncharacterized membrane protein